MRESSGNTHSGEIKQWADSVLQEVQKAFIGKPEVIQKILVAVLSGGHVLLEDIPGVGKTILARAISTALGGKFSRIQATPDLLPSDILGVTVYQPESKTFKYKRGPILSNIVLVDEINRATPRTQSALLEAMAEFQISIDGKTIPLPEPFMLIATENPIDFEGTFPLPEAQRDRFLMSLGIGYPDRNSESAIILGQRQARHPVEQLEAVSGNEDVLKHRRNILNIHMEKSILDYILDLSEATRNHSALKMGVSPRGSLSLSRSSQALAAIKGRDYVIPDDVKSLFASVFSQRIILKPESRMRNLTAAGVLEEILESVEAPTSENSGN